MNKAILILSHCNTEEKVNTLKDTIRDLKRFGMPIALHSHIPLDKEVLESVDYFIMDINNPIIDHTIKGMVVWRKLIYPGDDTKWLLLEDIVDDHGYTAFDQTKGGGNYLINSGYEYIHFINYDVTVDDNFIQLMENEESFLTTSAKQSIPTLMFFGLTKNDFEYLDANVNMEDYLSNSLIAEEILGNKLKPLGIPQLDLVMSSKHNMRTLINYRCDDYFLFVDNTLENGLIIYFFEVKKQMDMKILMGNISEIISFDSPYLFINTSTENIQDVIIEDIINSVTISIKPFFNNHHRQIIKSIDK